MVKKLPVLGMCIPTDELERAKTESPYRAIGHGDEIKSGNSVIDYFRPRKQEEIKSLSSKLCFFICIIFVNIDLWPCGDFLLYLNLIKSKLFLIIIK